MIRDNKSNALLNTDLKELNNYKIQRNRERKLENLRHEVTEIRTLINRVIDRIEKIENR